MKCLFIFAFTLCCLNSVAQADLIIDVGELLLLPNTANQRVSITIRSTSPGTDSAISGLDLRVELGDGFGGQPEPLFSGLDFTTGIFSTNPSSGGVVVGAPMVIQGGVLSLVDLTPNGTPQTLFDVLIDTQSFAVGEVFALRLVGHQTAGLSDTVLLGPIGMADPLPGVVINNGTIGISAIPEPGSIVLLGLSGWIFVGMRRRRSSLSTCQPPGVMS